MNAVTGILALGWLLAAPAAAQRFGSIEATPTLLPRYYQAASPFNPLDKRQSQCKDGQHPCLDIGELGAASCCPDDTYCIVDPSTGSKAACCAIGSVCGSSCAEDQIQCNDTTTITSPTRTVATVAACCPRPCTETSMFLCGPAFGGGCCSFGQDCASGRKCLGTSTPAPTSVVGEVPAGCTTGQVACSQGGGCCASTQRCTLNSEGSARCASMTASPPTGSGISTVQRDGGGGLSTGAKAGIAVAVVAGSGLVVGALTWFCLRRRKRRRRARGGSDGTDPMTGMVLGTAEPTPSSVGRRRDGSFIAGPGRGGEMSESHSDVVSHGGRLRGLTQDYFGPDAVSGPYTEEAYYDGSTPGAVAGRGRAVPMEPHGPDDITAPVEIGSSARDPTTVDRSLSVGTAVSTPRPPPGPETIEGRFELGSGDLDVPGSDGVSPYTPPVPTPSPGAESATLPAEEPGPTPPHVGYDPGEGINHTIR